MHTDRQTDRRTLRDRKQQPTNPPGMVLHTHVCTYLATYVHARRQTDGQTHTERQETTANPNPPGVILHTHVCTYLATYVHARRQTDGQTDRRALRDFKQQPNPNPPGMTFHKAPSRLEISELCILGLSCAILRL